MSLVVGLVVAELATICILLGAIVGLLSRREGQ